MTELHEIYPTSTRIAIWSWQHLFMGHGQFVMRGRNHLGEPFAVHMSVPPYVFMRSGVGCLREQFEVDFYLLSGNGAHRTTGPRVAVPADQYLEASGMDWFKLADRQLLEYGANPCITPGCSGWAWHKPPTAFARDRTFGIYKPVCETCRLAALQVEWDADDKRQAAKDAALDARRKAEGHTHKTLAWVHPSRGGDDYQLVMHSKGELKPHEIQAMLRREGSSVLTDWKQSPL